ncbi:splicing factor SF3a60 homolog [Zea mays]|uniref:splicing factor SF3a60 homolog n=1 Tax=Zea mays TaxID=4577 RepID=UPI0009A9FDBC|nr:splicing factor SF3a60 homolog [Zea mays]|eukprot:XP_020406477.1 splicing factor SF3a60 homolog [Zea mays]
MASMVLEATRVVHEDLERLERLAARELQREPDNSRGRFFQSHRIRHMLDLVVSTSCKLTMQRILGTHFGISDIISVSHRAIARRR